MGSYMSTTWFIYGRDQDDNWLSEPLVSSTQEVDNMEYHIKRFKYQVYQLGLGNLANVYKIYLYQGFRVARCVLKDETVTVELCSEAAKQAWSNSKRPTASRKFDSVYTKISEDPIVFTKNLDSQSAEH